MNLCFDTGLSHTRHYSEGRASVFAHVLRDTYEQVLITRERGQREEHGERGVCPHGTSS
jgi:hypothetical protein